MRSIRKTLETLASGIASFVLLNGCKERLADPIGAITTEDETPKRGGVVHLASYTEIRVLDPAVATDAFSHEAIEMMFAGLVDFDRDGHIVPDLADHYDVSNDGLDYTFTLRQGARFHDGSEVTAEDVRRSIDRALHPDTPSAFSTFYERIDGFDDYIQKKSQTLRGVHVDGRYVVSIHLKTPDATFLPAFAISMLRPVCPSAGTRYEDTWVPCGAGPFKLAPNGWERGRSLTLVRHDGYFRSPEPYFDGVVFTFGMNQTTQGFKLQAGELDATRELSLVDTFRFLADSRWESARFMEIGRSVWAQGMNTEMPPFDNVEVRRAVSCAIDREQIRLVRAPNMAVQTRVLPKIFGDDPSFQGQHYDLAEALEHMKRAGLAFDPQTGAGGWPHSIQYVAPKQSVEELASQIVQQQLAKIGIRLEIKIVTYPTYLALAQRRHTVAFAGVAWQADFPDASDFFEPIFATSAISEENSQNSSFYSNPKLDALLEVARRQSDPNVRKRMYDAADHIVCNDAPWAMTYGDRRLVVKQPYLRNFGPHAVWDNYLQKSWFDRGAIAATKRAGIFSQVIMGVLP